MPDKKNENVQLRSEEVQEILTKVPHWMIRWGNLLFLILFLLLIVLTWFIKYPDIITAESILTTEVPPQKEYAKTSGKITHFLVEDQQKVNENQLLAIIENTANYKDVYQLKKIVDTISLQQKPFVFPLRNLPILYLGDISTEYALFVNAYTQYMMNKKYEPFSNEVIANRLSLSELNSRLQSIIAQKAISEKELKIQRKDLKRAKSLFDKEVISEQEYEKNLMQFLAAERNLKNLNISISQINEAITNSHKVSKSASYNQINEEIKLLNKVYQSFNQLKKSIKQWELQYVLKSKIKGKVSFLNYWAINQNINAGNLIFTIIPANNSSFIAKLKAPAKNSGKIKLNQKVLIRLENYPSQEFGVLNGNVKSISLLPNEQGFYLVDVIIPNTLITSYKKKIAFKQEMKGVAEIITEDLRLIDRFFYQLRELLSK